MEQSRETLDLMENYFNDGVAAGKEVILHGLKSVEANHPGYTMSIEDVIKMIDGYEFTKLKL